MVHTFQRSINTVTGQLPLLSLSSRWLLLCCYTMSGNDIFFDWNKIRKIRLSNKYLTHCWTYNLKWPLLFHNTCENSHCKLKKKKTCFVLTAQRSITNRTVTKFISWEQSMQNKLDVNVMIKIIQEHNISEHF